MLFFFPLVFKSFSHCAAFQLVVLNVVSPIQICWACILLNFSGLGLLLYRWFKRTENALAVTWQAPENLSAFGLVNCTLCMQITGICSKHYFGKHRWLQIDAKIYFQFLQSGSNTDTQPHYISKFRIYVISCIASKQKWDSNIQAPRAWY